MKSSAAFLAAILALACLALPVSGLESNFLTICEKNLSIDLDPGFEIDRIEFNTSSDGMVFDEFIINNNALPGSAFISIISIYDSLFRKMNPEALADFFLIAGIEAAKDKGDSEIDQWTAISSSGRNVTVHTMNAENEDLQMAEGVYDISVWSLDETTLALLVSSLDRENTTKIIETLAIS